MKKTLMLASVAAFAFVANANALEVNPYVSAKLSYDWAKNELKANGDYSGEAYGEKLKLHKNIWGGHYAAGFKAKAVRAEVEWNHYQDAKKKDYSDEGKDRYRLQNNSLLLNAYYDINTCTKWTPYVGVGMGVAMLKFTDKDAASSDKYSDRTYNFAWQVGAGVAYDLTSHVALDAGYRYINAGSAVFDKEIDDGDFSKEKVRSAAHEIYLGARYTF